MRIAVVVAGLALLCACRTTPRVPEPPPDPLKRIVTGLDEVRAAVREWRDEMGVEGRVDIATFRQVWEATTSIAQELQPLAKRLKHPDPTPSWLVKAARGPETPPSPSQVSRAWIDDMRALGDGAGERRERAIVALRAALTGQDADAQIAALRTLQAVGDIEYDKASFRSLVLPFARESVGPAIEPAFYALSNTAREAEDLALVHAAWLRDPIALRDSILHLMTTFSGGTLEGRSEEIAVEWLRTYDGGNVGISGMWGARVGPQLEARMIDLARSNQPTFRHAAIYFGLSTFEDKSPAVVEELIATLTDPDHNNSGRALWGLGHGVPDAQKPRVVTALIELHKNRSDPQTRTTCARIVQEYGGDEAAARLAH